MAGIIAEIIGVIIVLWICWEIMKKYAYVQNPPLIFRMIQLAIIAFWLFTICKLLTMGFFGWVMLVPFFLISFIIWKKWVEHINKK